MYRNKSEIDKHVSGLLYNAKNEHERNLRCFHIAQLYYKSQDYESAQRYVTMYLSVQDDSSAAHKLLGQAYEGMGQKSKAINAYTKSLKLEPNQSDLILKMCELLCDKDVQFDPVLARHWADRAASIFPHSPPVFMLKEKLLTSDSNLLSKDLEELLHAELKAKPMDFAIRIKLLKLYADSGRAEMALKNAFEVESRQNYINSFPWYQCINNICKTYHRENSEKCDWEFYVQWLSALDRMCFLSITESTSYDISEAINSVYSLDQAIFIASHSSKKADILREYLKHISAQLAYHLGVLLIKLEKKQNNTWKETKRFVCPLFLLASILPPQSDQSWAFSLNNHQRKLLQLWINQGHCRIVQSGHLLLSLVKENHSEKMFLDRVNHFVSSDWKLLVYKKAFESTREAKSATSHFLTGTEYVKVPLKIPSSNSLKPSLYVSSFENCYFGSLHHLTWLGLRALKKTNVLDIKLPMFYTTCFKSLQLTINNLNNISVETLNRLDVDSFLYATVFSTGSFLSVQHFNGALYEERPEVLPADVSSPLISKEQDKWWSNLCSLVKGNLTCQTNSNESMSDIRFSLQRGLEVVRGEGLSTFLIVALARTFASRATTSNIIEESQACHARALHLWNIVYPKLERLVSKKPLISTPKSKSALFEFPEDEIGPQEAKVVLEEAKFFVGCHYMNTKQYEKAVEEFKSLKNPQALFNLAMVYKKWAEEQIEGIQGEEITSEIRCRHIVLATKARDHLLALKSLIKNDTKDPLHSSIDAKIFDVEDMLKRIEPENGNSERDVNGTFDGSASYGSGVSPIREAMNILASANHQRTRPHTSTPRRIQEQKTNRFNMSELIDLLSVQQSTNQLKMQQVLEQIRLVLDKLESVASEQRSQKSLVEGLNSRLNNFESEMKTTISDLKKDMKRPDLCNVFDEDDYTDEMLQYQSYPQYYSTPHQRVQLVNPAPPVPVPHVNPQYFSPRIDPLCQGFYNQQGALSFSEGQQLPDFLRPKVSQPLLHSLQPGVVPPPLNLSGSIPGPGRLATTIAISSGVITTSDPLSSIAPSLSAALSVNIPTSQNTSASNAPHNFQIPLPPQPKPTISIEERVVDEETPPPTYDPLPDYKPIVPLPDEVEVHTGEEDEEVLFEKRAKLFRFVEKAWKERGIGNIKILKNKSTGKVRILMRREQVHKVCANHFLTPDMELQPKNNSENTWIWYANDYADETVQSEKFCVKFKTSEESEEFKTVFDKAVEEIKVVKDVTSSSQVSQNKSFDSSILESRKTPVSSFSTNILSTNSSSNIFSSTASSNTFFGAAPSGLFSGTAPSTTFSTSPALGVFSSSALPGPFTSNSSSNLFSNAISNAFSTSAPSNVFFTSSPNLSSSGATSSAPKITFSSGSNSQDSSSQSSSSQGPVKVGGFSFSLAQPKLKVPEQPKPEKEVTKTEPSPFSKVNFPVISSSRDAATIFSTIATPKTSEPSKAFSGIFSSSFGTPESTSSPVFSSTTPSTLFTQPKESEIKQGNAKGNVSAENNDPTNQEEDADNFVPTATFEPLIPLPKLVDVKTGEENEEVIFEDRAQLYRYCKETKQWKERGIGQMKILKNTETGTVRLLMRREKVLKVCCNHRITKELSLKQASSSSTAYTWATKDYSEDEPTDEIFSLKFKTSEQADRFKDAFIKAQSEFSLKPESKSPSVKNQQAPLSAVIKKAPGSWECSSCYSSNKAESNACAACTARKPGATAPPAVSEKNKEDPPRVSNIVTTTTTKSSEKKDISSKSKDNADSTKPLLSELFKPNSGSWECQACYISNKAEVEVCAACNTAKPGTVLKTVEETDKPKTVFSFGIPPNLQPASGTSTGSFNFGSPSIQTPATGSFIEPSTVSSTGDKFSFAPAKFTIGTSSAKDPVFGIVSSSSTPSIKSGFDFSAPSSNKPTESTDSGFGSKTFQFSMKVPDATSPTGNKSILDDSYDPEEEQDHVQYQPVVPLPDKVEVITGEEDEDVLYSHRAKLYRYDTSSKEWKERGLGDLKILQHKETRKIRFLMRREPVMKVCLNHLITEDILLRTKDDKSWQWFAVDYADGSQSNEQFAVRFKNSDIAQEFKKEFDKAKLLLSKPSSAITPTSKLGKENNLDDNNKTDAVSSYSDSDVEIVSEEKAPPELVEKALQLKLPANFYCYLDRPPCPGCVGCESDEKDDEIGVSKEKESDKKEESMVSQKPNDPVKSSSVSQNLFGSVQSSESASVAPTIFGSPAFLPKCAGFTFAQAFNSSADSTPKSTGGFLFGDKTSFTAADPQSNIFTSGVSRDSNQPFSTQPFSAASNMPTFGSVATLGRSESDTSQPTSTIQPFSAVSNVPSFGSIASSGGSVSDISQPTSTTQPFSAVSNVPSFGSIASSGGNLSTTGFNFGNSNTGFSSFSSISGGGDSSFAKSSTDFKWDGAGTQVFSSVSKANTTSGSSKGNLNETGGEGDNSEDDDGEEDENDPYFEPQVPLPDKIEVKTGEEDEEVLFCERGLLYRYSSETKEWKERGTGEMKVLKHKTQNKFRLLMRREQVYKIVCNHFIKSDLSMTCKTPKALQWSAMNYSDDTHHFEFLSIRFKTEEIANKFKNIVEDCIAKAKEENKKELQNE